MEMIETVLRFCNQMIEYIQKANPCFGYVVDEDEQINERELVPLMEYDRELEFGDLNEDVKSHLFSYLGVKDLLALAQVSSTEYDIVHKKMGAYLTDRFGIFNRGVISENRLALHALSCFYKAYKANKAIDDFENTEEDNKLFQEAFVGFQHLKDIGKKWPDLYLAVMRCHGKGVEQNLLQARIHIDELKKTWLSWDSALENSNPQLRELFANTLLSNYFDSWSKSVSDISDVDYYNQHLNPANLCG